MSKPHLSASQLEMYARCPEAYRRRYIEGEKIPPGIALLVGSGVHSGAEMNFRQKIESHEDMPVADIVDSAVAGFEIRCATDGYELGPDEKPRGAKIVIGEAKDLVSKLARVHAIEQAPEYQPVAVEQATTIVLPDCSRDLAAITDLRDDQGRVVDLKTASRKPSQDDADSSLQLTIYSAAYQVDTGEAPKELRLDVLTKTKVPARHILSTQRTMRDIEALAARIETTVDAIEAGVFPPASPGSWVCSERWCGYWRTCRYAQGRKG